MLKSNLESVPVWRTFELDQVVVGAVGGEQSASVLKVLAFCLTLQHLLASFVKPVGEEDAQLKPSHNETACAQGPTTRAIFS